MAQELSQCQVEKLIQEMLENAGTSFVPGRIRMYARCVTEFYCITRPNQLEKMLLSFLICDDDMKIVKFLISNGENIYCDDIDFAFVIEHSFIKMTKLLAKKYFIDGVRIPDKCIKNDDSEVYKVLIRYVEPDQYHLFHVDVVNSLGVCKSARNV